MERRVLGITGCMASGKSAAAAYLRRVWGVSEIDVDRVGHLLLPSLRAPLRSAFGDAIFDEKGDVSRPALARVVFASPCPGTGTGTGALRQLEAIMHPAMKDEIRRILEQAASQGGVWSVINAALLYRMGLHELCDRVLFIDAPREMCVLRALEREHRTREEIERILNSQEDVNRSRCFADVVIGNAASPEEFHERMRAFAQTYFGSQFNGDAENAERDARRTQEGTLYP